VPPYVILVLYPTFPFLEPRFFPIQLTLASEPPQNPTPAAERGSYPLQDFLLQRISREDRALFSSLRAFFGADPERNPFSSTLCGDSVESASSRPNPVSSPPVPNPVPRACTFCFFSLRPALPLQLPCAFTGLRNHLFLEPPPLAEARLPQKFPLPSSISVPFSLGVFKLFSSSICRLSYFQIFF